VRGAERLVHVGVLSRDQLVHEGGVVGGLAGREAEVLQERDAGRELGEARADGGHVQARVGAPFGPSEMAARGDLGTPVEKPGERRERGPDPEVVDDPPAPGRARVVLERHVEVDPHEDLPAPHVGEVFEQREAARRRWRGGR